MRFFSTHYTSNRCLKLVLAFAILTSSVFVGKAAAQNVPKPAQTERILRKDKKPAFPQSLFDSKIIKIPKDLPVSEQEDIRFVLSGVVVHGSTVYKQSDLLPLYRRFLNEEVSLSQMYKLAARITAKYRNDGYLLSKVIVPPQRIHDGSISFQAVEGFIDRVVIDGDIKGPRELLESYTNKITESRPLHSSILERYLLLINDLPGVTVKSVLTPSQTNPGASNLTLVMEHKSFGGYLGVDNRGSRFNGPMQGFVGVDFNSLFSVYEHVGMRFITASQTEELTYANVFLENQLFSEGTKLVYSASVGSTEPGYTLKDYNVQGDSTTASVMLVHPFIRTRAKNLSTNLGFNYLNSRTDILGAKNSEDKLRVLSFGFNYDYVDGLRGINLLSLNLSQGLDILNATDNNSSTLSRANGKSNFRKLSGDLMRLQQLMPRWSLLLSSTWQYSFDELLASEEFGVGGSEYARAYDSSEITGDHGIAAKAELQYSFESFKNLQTYIFYDYGTVKQKNPAAGEDEQEQIYSAGAGMRYNLTDSISGYLEADKPLARRVSAEDDKDWRVFFRTALRF